jgi:hypothetical protein
MAPKGKVMQRPAATAAGKGKGKGKGKDNVIQRPAATAAGKGKGKGKGKDNVIREPVGMDIDAEFEGYLAWVHAGRPLPAPEGAMEFDYFMGLAPHCRVVM